MEIKGFDSKFQLFIQGWIKYSCFNTKYEYGYAIYQDDAYISNAVCTQYADCSTYLSLDKSLLNMYYVICNIGINTGDTRNPGPGSLFIIPSRRSIMTNNVS